MYSWGDAVNQSTKPTMNFHNPTYDGKRGLKGKNAYKEFLASPDQTTSANLATRMRDAIHAVRGKTYTVEQDFGLYPTAGTSDDYANSRHFADASKGKIIYSFTIEWGTEFQPPYAEMQQIMQENSAALLDFCLAAIATPAVTLASARA